MLGILTRLEFQYSGISPVPKSSANMRRMFGCLELATFGDDLLVDVSDGVTNLVVVNFGCWIVGTEVGSEGPVVVVVWVDISA